MGKFLKYGGIGTSPKLYGGTGMTNKKAILFIVIAGAFLYYMLVIRRRKWLAKPEAPIWSGYIQMGMEGKGEKYPHYKRLMKYVWVFVIVGVIYWYYKKRKGVRA